MPETARAPRKRPPVKQQAVARQLRRQIVEGVFPPGTQLPVRSRLEKQLRVSSNTLQRAIDQLIGEGFIYAQGTAGTFVGQHPPHLSHYAVLAPHRGEASLNRNGFIQAVMNEATRRSEQGPWQFPIYTVGSAIVDEQEVGRLIADARDKRLAGLMFLVGPQAFKGTPVLDEAYPGKVAVNSGSHANHEIGVSTIDFDWRTFIRRALDALVERGRKRIALVAGSDSANFFEPLLMSMARERGLESGPQWIQGVEISKPWAANHLAQLLMYATPDRRPDGLVIADDNLVEHTAAGLLTKGVRIPDQLDVVAHCNFPWPPPGGVPMLRLGFDARDVFDKAVALMDAQRERKRVGHDILHPVFERELEGGGTQVIASSRSRSAHSA